MIQTDQKLPEPGAKVDPVTVLMIIHDFVLCIRNRDNCDEQAFAQLVNACQTSPDEVCTAVGLIEHAAEHYAANPDEVAKIAQEC